MRTFQVRVIGDSEVKDTFGRGLKYVLDTQLATVDPNDLRGYSITGSDRLAINYTDAAAKRGVLDRIRNYYGDADVTLIVFGRDAARTGQVNEAITFLANVVPVLKQRTKRKVFFITPSTPDGISLADAQRFEVEAKKLLGDGNVFAVSDKSGNQKVVAMFQSLTKAIADASMGIMRIVVPDTSGDFNLPPDATNPPPANAPAPTVDRETGEEIVRGDDANIKPPAKMPVALKLAGYAVLFWFGMVVVKDMTRKRTRFVTRPVNGLGGDVYYGGFGVKPLPPGSPEPSRLSEEQVIINGALQKLRLEDRGIILVGGPWFKKIKSSMGLKARTRKDAIAELVARSAALRSE